MAQAFKVQRGTATIASGDTTESITAGTDYVAPAALSRSFIRIVGTRLTGAGRASGGSSMTPDEFTAFISNPGNLLTSITFERAASTEDTRIDWEIIEYVGPAGGPNEFIVRDQWAVTDHSTTTDAHTLASTASSASDLVPFITSQATEDSDSSNIESMLYTVDAPTTTTVTIRRGTNHDSALANVSVAAVEFTGSNWSVQRESFDLAGMTAWDRASTSLPTDYNSVSLSTAISDIDKSFIHPQYRTDYDGAGRDRLGAAVKLQSTTAFRVWVRKASADLKHVVWLVSNSQASSAVRNLDVQHGAAYLDNGGSEPQDTSLAITAVDALDESSIMGESTSVDGSATSWPRSFDGLRLTSTSTAGWWRCDTGEEQVTAFDVVQWPEDESATAALIAPSATSSSSASFTAPASTHDGAASLDTASVGSTSSATHIAPTSTSSAALDLAPIGSSSTAAHSPPVFDAAAAAALGPAMTTAAATSAPSEFACSASLSVSSALASSTATTTAPVSVATSALTLSGVSAQSSTGFAPPQSTATSPLALSPTVISSSATTTRPTFEASSALGIASTQIQATASWSLAVEAPPAGLVLTLDRQPQFHVATSSSFRLDPAPVFVVPDPPSFTATVSPRITAE